MFHSGHFINRRRLPSTSTNGLPRDTAPVDAALLAEGVKPAPTLQQCALFPGQTHHQSQQSAHSGERCAEVKHQFIQTLCERITLLDHTKSCCPIVLEPSQESMGTCFRSTQFSCVKESYLIALNNNKVILLCITPPIMVGKLVMFGNNYVTSTQFVVQNHWHGY